MSFGQQTGPSASARKLQALLAVVKDAGYADFRAARGPLHLTQRQGSGKFTEQEADELLAQLQGDDVDDGRTPAAPTATAERPLRDVPTDELVAELRRRGRTVSGA